MERHFGVYRRVTAGLRQDNRAQRLKSLALTRIFLAQDREVEADQEESSLRTGALPSPGSTRQRAAIVLSLFCSLWPETVPGSRSARVKEGRTHCA